jgi:hypothetical protein
MRMSFFFFLTEGIKNGYKPGDDFSVTEIIGFVTVRDVFLFSSLGFCNAVPTFLAGISPLICFDKKSKKKKREFQNS